MADFTELVGTNLTYFSIPEEHTFHYLLDGESHKVYNDLRRLLPLKVTEVREYGIYVFVILQNGRFRITFNLNQYTQAFRKVIEEYVNFRFRPSKKESSDLYLQYMNLEISEHSLVSDRKIPIFDTIQADKLFLYSFEEFKNKLFIYKEIGFVLSDERIFSGLSVEDIETLLFITNIHPASKCSKIDEDVLYQLYTFWINNSYKNHTEILSCYQTKFTFLRRLKQYSIKHCVIQKLYF